MKKFYYLTLLLVLSNVVFSQVGINTENPTETFDVNGTLRIRSTELLSSNRVSSLYVDENGVVGKSFISPGSPLTTFISATASTDIATAFNAGNVIELPITATTIDLNTLNVNLANNRIRIPEGGTYQLSASLNISLGTGNLNDNVFLAFNIQVSKDNGGTWEAISGNRPIFNMLTAGAFAYNTMLPTGLANLDEGDLLRLVIFRSRAGNTLQGSRLEVGLVRSVPKHGTKSFTLSLTKL